METSRRVFVGGLAFATTTESLQRAFESCGAVEQAEVVYDLAGKSKGFGFVSFVDEQSVEEAIRKISGTEIDGRAVTVSKATARGEGGPRADRGYGGPRYDDRGGGVQRRGPGSMARGVKIRLAGLPSHFTWRELKDFLRAEGVEATYADMQGGGQGVAEYPTHELCMAAIRKLDGRTINGMLIAAYEQDGGDGGRGYSRPADGYGSRGGYDDGYGGGGGGYNRGGAGSYAADRGYSSAPRGGYGYGGAAYADRGYDAGSYGGGGGYAAGGYGNGGYAAGGYDAGGYGAGRRAGSYGSGAGYGGAYGAGGDRGGYGNMRRAPY